MTIRTSPLGRTLHTAIARVRQEIGDPVAPVVVITASNANGTLARQQLALAGDFIRVELCTPADLVRALGAPRLAEQGLCAQTDAWLSATVGAVVQHLAGEGRLGRLQEVLLQPGWTHALARAVRDLEAAGVSAVQLRALTDSPHRDRLIVFADLLEGVTAQRSVDRMYALGALCDAALRDLRSHRWAGAVLLGDGLLPPSVHHVLRAWLAAHPHVEVRPHAFAALPPAPTGLRAAASGDVLDIEAPPEREVVLARTPDDVRELAEAVRVALDAIHDGVSLDRIALVVPDAEQIEVLRAHLSRAGVPATWLTGPPLTTRPAAGFLLALLDLASGGDTVPAWYELLRLPGLRLRTLAPDATEGRGRWRRILARSGSVRHTDTIVRAVEAWTAGLDDGAWDPEGDRRSAANLVRAIQGLSAVLEGLRQPATVGTHARRWTEVLDRWWVPSPDHAQVRTMLSAWGSAGTGPVLSLEAAVAELRDSLDRTPALEGTLSDPAVRVTTPMGLLGGAFDHVLVTGATEGRLPRRPGEDALLPDRLVAELNARLGSSLLGSHDLAAFEDRRLASILSACTGTLWLSAPATEMLEERPLLPSTFLLELASERLGRRARYADLARLQQRFGSRARPWPDDPDRAVGPLEHRVATTAATPAAGLRRLALDATARRLLGLQRALDTKAPTAWTGRVPPDAIEVPGLDGSALAPRHLALLAADPGAYFVDRVLGVRRAPGLYAASDPARRFLQDRQLIDAIDQALQSGAPDLVAATLDAWDDAMATWAEHRSDVTDDILGLLRALTEQRVQHLVAAGTLPRGERHPFAGAPVPELPWTIEGDVGWTDGDVLSDLQDRKPARRKLFRDAPELVLAAMVSPEVTHLRVGAVDGRDQDGDLQAEGAALTEQLRVATRCVRAGWWPHTRTHGVLLSAEAQVDLSDPEAVQAALRGAR